MRRVLIIVGMLAAVASAMPEDARAQATRADSAAILYDAAQRLGIEGKRAAAEAVLDYVLRRFGDTPAAAQAREWLRTRPAEPERSGRLELLAWGTVYGAWLGLAVPTAVGATGTTPYGLGLIVGGPLGFLASTAYADANRPTLGQARAMTLGFRWGSWQVAGWYGALTSGSVSTEGVFTALIAGGLGGMTVAALYGRHRTVPAGVVAAASHGASWGMWFGLMGSLVVSLDGETTFKMVLASGDVGLLAAAITAPRDITSGRVWLTTAAGIAGIAVGGGIDLLIQPDNAKVAALIPTVTSAVGLAFGAMLAKSVERERSAELPGRTTPEPTALLQVDEAGIRLGVPAPVPTLVPVGEHNFRRIYKPALAVSLFHAEF